MHVYNKKLASAVVLNADFASQPFDVQQIYGYAIQAVWTGTPTGTFKLQASSDPATSYNSGNAPGSNVVTNWTDIAGSSTVVSAAGDFMWNNFNVMYNWVRLVYTDGSSGSSTAVMNAIINSKAP